MSDFRLVIILIVIVLLNTATLSILTYKGHQWYSDIHQRTAPVRQVAAVLNGKAPVAPVERHLGAFLSDVAGEFFFGSFDGTVPAFVQNLLTTDFAGIASNVSMFMTEVNQAFVPFDCNMRNCSYANQEIYCGGRVRYCNYAGQTIDCGDAAAGCIPPALSQAALAVKSVTDKIATLQKVNGGAAGPAAMSNGVFRLDVIFDWIGAQVSFPAWTAAANVASNFVANMRRVDLSGCPRNMESERNECWDANQGFTAVLDTINQVSYPLAAPAPIPVPTAGPATMAPGQTQSPGASTASPGTLAPGQTQAPGASTSAPGTLAPGQTQSPAGSTSSPGTLAPGQTAAPAQTLSPGATMAPGVTLSPGATASPQTAAPFRPPTPAPTLAPVPQTFTASLTAGTTEVMMVNSVAVALGIPVSDIEATTLPDGEVRFTFKTANAGLLSERLEVLTATPEGRASLGVASIQAAPVDNGSTSSGSNSMAIGIGAGVGGAVLGIAIAVAVYVKMSSAGGAAAAQGAAAGDAMPTGEKGLLNADDHELRNPKDV